MESSFKYKLADGTEHETSSRQFGCWGFLKARGFDEGSAIRHYFTGVPPLDEVEESYLMFHPQKERYTMVDEATRVPWSTQEHAGMLEYLKSGYDTLFGSDNYIWSPIKHSTRSRMGYQAPLGISTKLPSSYMYIFLRIIKKLDYYGYLESLHECKLLGMPPVMGLLVADLFCGRGPTQGGMSTGDSIILKASSKNLIDTILTINETGSFFDISLRDHIYSETYDGISMTSMGVATGLSPREGRRTSGRFKDYSFETLTKILLQELNGETDK